MPSWINIKKLKCVSLNSKRIDDNYKINQEWYRHMWITWSFNSWLFISKYQFDVIEWMKLLSRGVDIWTVRKTLVLK